MCNSFIKEKDPVFIIAEIGANHNNNIEDIKKIVKSAKDCGVNAVKFQTYTPSELLADGDRIITWGKSGEETTESVSQMFEKVVFDRSKHKEIFDYAKSLGLIVFSTPFSPEGVNFLNDLDVPYFKIASSDVGYTDMLIEAAKTKKPIILSIGKSTLSEVDKAINLLEENGCKDIIIMHCVAQYPSPMEEMNLKVIKTLKTMYPEYTVGFSDHSLGITAALGAVAFGAKVIEKHFTIDKKISGPDHWFSMDPKDMTNLVLEVRNLEIAIGSSRKKVFECEKKERVTSTRSLVINRDMKSGEVIKEEDLNMLRPGWGISPWDKEKIIGLKITMDLKKNTILEWKYFK